MSHAINIYIELSSEMYDEEKDKRPSEKRYLLSYVGCSNIYSLFRDLGIDHYCGMDGNSYAELTSSVLDNALEDVKNDIKTVKNKIKTYEKLAQGNKEIIDEVISSKEYLEELFDTKKDVEFLDTLLQKLKWEGHKLFYNSY